MNSVEVTARCVLAARHAYGAAARDHFANQLFCVQGKDWLAGSPWDRAGDC
jgi:hypothetical protein